MKENEVKKRIRVEFQKLTGGRSWNNPVGTGFVGELLSQARDIFKIKGRKISMGFGRGSADVIGIMPMIIRDHHVGKTVGVFCAFEIKNKNWKFKNTKHEQEQLRFLELVKKKGGVAGFVRDEKDLKNHINF